VVPRQPAVRAASSAAPTLDSLSGGGEVGARLRALDWSRTPLGPPAHWPQSLKTIVRVMLDSRYAMWMLWGADLTFFCNDAYLPTVGIRRDWVLGARADKVWEEIWPDIGPRIQRVLEHGEATWDEALMLFLARSGFTEETYHTFSYSPVYDDENRIAGMLCVVTEVTERVIGERHLRVLRDLAARASGIETVQQACDRLVGVLSEDLLDVPFSCLYVLDEAAPQGRLASHHGNIPERLRPGTVVAGQDDPWRFAAALLRDESRVVTLSDLGERIPSPLWPEQLITQAMVLPIRGQGPALPSAVLVAGLSPRQALGDSYRGFLDLIARQFAAAIADAQAYEAEQQRAEALAALDRAKTIFFSNVSHEFRTPLTLMMGPITEALANPATPEPVRQQLELAQRNSLRLSKLVNSLLDFSRIEAGRAQASYEPTDLAALTRDLASTFRSTMERAGLRFTVACETLPEPVYLDHEMWEKIVLNLLSNAFKFTLAGEISVRVWHADRHAMLEVADTGAGIAPHELPRLFERFHRIEGSAGRTQEGSGIGLALAQELVRLHGGTIDAASELGRGSAFRIRIPFGSTHLPAERIKAPRELSSTATSAQTYVQEALRWLPDPSSRTLPLAVSVADHTAAIADAVARGGKRARLLLADDNADMRAYVRELLSPLYELELAADGEQALAAALRARPDLILSDVMMPRLDGFGLLKAVRENEALRDIPFILLTARAGEEARVEGLAAGVDDYLVKPFIARELLARVGGSLALARMRGELRARELTLREADRRKDEFLAMLAHELRNPLAPIRNANELLGKILRVADRRVENAIAITRRQVAQLTRLVDDLLDVSRVTQGRIELQRRPVDIPHVIVQAIEAVQPVLRERHHRLVSVHSAEHPALYVNADPARLIQCVVNVLTNAAKYTDPGGEITVQTRGEGKQAVIEISDTGVGIAAELLPHMFELFVQGDRSLDRAQGGLGVGLAVVKRLVEMHGGTVVAHSAGPGQGATFEIRLPLIEHRHAPPAGAAPPKVPAARILIVDDNHDAADSLGALLALEGHTVQMAYSAADALQRAAPFRAQVVLLDIGLPQMDGYEVARHLRRIPQLCDTRVIAVTGYGQRRDRERAAAAGFDEHLVKPVSPASVARALAGIARKARDR
jgi:signal transduction histidine kinase